MNWATDMGAVRPRLPPGHRAVNFPGNLRRCTEVMMVDIFTCCSSRRSRAGARLASRARIRPNHQSIGAPVKPGIHPLYLTATVNCACGNKFETRSTTPSIHVEICAKCHPYFTGKQKLIDTAGRVERFRQRYKSPEAKAEAKIEAQAKAEAQAREA